MDFYIASILAQDGMVTGAVYALIALALVLIFSVTRIIFVPQGEFVTFGALTLAQLEAGNMPGVFWLLLVMTVWAVLETLLERNRSRGWRLVRELIVLVAPTIFATLLVMTPGLLTGSFWLRILATCAIVVPLGPLLYRTVYRPVAESSVLLLLIVSAAVHTALTGIGLYLFGSEGVRNPALANFGLTLGDLRFSGSQVSVLVVTATAMAALAVVFRYSITGKALRAIASNSSGARIVGIRPERGGALAFGLAALLGVLSGLLIGPLTTLYYDTGFLIALKGFVAAIVGGLSSFPLAVGGALFVGLTESFASFYASSLKEAIVFFLVVPILLWRSLGHTYSEDQ